MENGCLPGSPGNVFDGVLFCVVFFSSDVLDETWEWIESVLENFLTYSLRGFLEFTQNAVYLTQSVVSLFESDVAH